MKTQATQNIKSFILEPSQISASRPDARIDLPLMEKIGILRKYNSEEKEGLDRRLAETKKE
jgi:hypothetical protein